MGLSEQLQKLNLGEIASQKIAGIQNNGHRILSLVDQILDLRKLESGKFQIKFVQKEIVPLLNYAGQNVKPLAVDKGINCLLYTSPSPRDQRGSRMPSSA